MNKTKTENVSDTSLSQKYSVLRKYRIGLLFLMVILTFISFGIIVVYYDDTRTGIRITQYMIAIYIISMFGLSCIAKIIDFLFDLDRDKTNK